MVVLVGYPARERAELGGVLYHQDVMLQMEVTDVSNSGTNLLMQYTNPERILGKGARGPAPGLDEYAWGGMSGSMVYRLDLSPNFLHVAGFFYKAQLGTNGCFFVA